MTRIRKLLTIMVLMAIGVNGLTAAEKIKKEKLQVFIMLGQSNMVGLSQIGIFQYLLQEPYKPAFEKAIGLPIAKRTHIYAYGALTSPHR